MPRVLLGRAFILEELDSLRGAGFLNFDQGSGSNLTLGASLDGGEEFTRLGGPEKALGIMIGLVDKIEGWRLAVLPRIGTRRASVG